MAGVDQDDRHLGGRCTRHHVAGVLLVTRGVGNDELALRGREVAVRHVDRDALLAFGLETVGQQCKVGQLAGGALSRRVGLE